MSFSRRFLVASSLARLIRKERGGNRVTEGYFPNQADRTSYVHIEGDQSSLVLLTTGSGLPVEERTDVPRTHAEALLDVTPGKVDYVRSTLAIGTRDLRVFRFVTPGPLDLISVDFEREDEARDFRPLSWFGPEVTDEAGFQNYAIAIDGIPALPEIPLTNTALNSLLDVFENRFGTSRAYTPPQARKGPEASEQPRRRQGEEKPSPSLDSSRVSVEVDGLSEDRDRLDLHIEDNVIRELARSLRPQRKP